MVRGKIIAIAVGLLVLGIGLRLWLGSRSAPPAERVSRPAAPLAAPAVRQGASGAPALPRSAMPEASAALETMASGPWGRNPFLTPPEEAALTRQPASADASPDFAPREVKAILVSEGRRFAMINGHMVAEGDYIGGERVLEIRPRAVVLGRGTRTRTVEMRFPGTPIRSRPGPMGPPQEGEGGRTSR